MATGGPLSVNRPNADISINRAASYWLFAVFALMLLSTIFFLISSHRRPLGSRLFHYLAIMILATASIAYFTMASDLGSTPITAQLHHGGSYGVTRAIWYVRYVMWAITGPLLLLELLLITGLPLSDILLVIFMCLVAVVSALIGALVASRYKWAYFAFACAALFYIAFHVFFHGRKSTRAHASAVHRVFTRHAGYLMFIWMIYPIAWGLSEGGNRISPLKEMIFYGVLDILSMPVFLFLHLHGLRGIPYDSFALSSGKASVGAGGNVGGPTYGSAQPMATGDGVAGGPTLAGRGHLGHHGVGLNGAEQGTAPLASNTASRHVGTGAV